MRSFLVHLARTIEVAKAGAPSATLAPGVEAVIHRRTLAALTLIAGLAAATGCQKDSPKQHRSDSVPIEKGTPFGLDESGRYNTMDECIKSCENSHRCVPFPRGFNLCVRTCRRDADCGTGKACACSAEGCTGGIYTRAGIDLNFLCFDLYP